MSVNPFPGPQPYRTADRHVFCGREDAAKRLASTIIARRCITLFGPSGAGKSSLMQAAVIPELIDSRDVRPVRVDSWPADKEHTPAEWLLAALFEQLRLGEPPADPKPIDRLGVAIERAERRSSRPILIYLDQMEQILLQDRDPAHLEVFITCVDRLAGQPSAGLHVVLAMREDYLGRFRDKARGRRRLLENGFRLGPLTVGDMVDSVVAAAARGEPPQAWSAEEIRPLMLEVRTPGQSESDEAEVEAAYAQIVCRALFAERARDGMPSARGGPVRAEPILQEYLEATIASLGDQRAHAIRLLEEHLIAADGSRTLLTEKEARAALPEGAFEPILRALEGAAVLRSEAHQGSRYFEIGHDWLAKKVHEQRQRLARERALRELIEREETERRAKAQRESARRLRIFLTATAIGLSVTIVLAIVAFRQRNDAVVARQRAMEAQTEAVGARRRARDLLLLAGARALLARDSAMWAADLLLETDNPEDMEAFGWRDLALSALGRATTSISLSGHKEDLTNVVFSHDGQRVLTSSVDGTARAYSVDGTGNPVVIDGRAGAMFAACYSADDKRVISASADGVFAIWDAATGELKKDRKRRSPMKFAACAPGGGRVLALFEDNKALVWDASGDADPVELSGHTGPLRTGAFSPDGARVAVVVDTGALEQDARRRADCAYVWSVERPTSPYVFKSLVGPLLSAVWSPDGRRFLMTSEDGYGLVERANGDGDPVLLAGHKGTVTSAAFSPDGQHIVTASADKTARIWRTDGMGDPIVLKGHDLALFSVAYSPDGRRIVTSSRDGTARIWQADGTGDPTVLKGHEGSVLSAIYSPDGKRVATISGDKTARVWRAGGAQEPLVLEGHESRVFYAAFSADSTKVLTASEDATARVWPVDGASPPAVLRGGGDMLRGASMNPDGSFVAMAMVDGLVRIWNADGYGEPAVLKGHTGWVTSVVWSPDGARLATASEDSTVRIWNIQGGSGYVPLKGHSSWVHSVAWSPDGKRIASGSADLTVRVWNADGSGTPVVLNNKSGVVTSVAWSPKGDKILGVSGDFIARIWNADGRGDPVELKGHEGWISSARWSSDGLRVVTASKDKTARIWSDRGVEMTVLSGHDAGVAMAAFSPDGERVLTASGDGVARIWKFPAIGPPVVEQALEGHNGAILYASWSSDGQRVVTASSDGTARVFSPFIPLERLRERLMGVGVECLPASLRAAYLDETADEAKERFEECQRTGRRQSLARGGAAGGSSADPAPSQSVSGEVKGAPVPTSGSKRPKRPTILLPGLSTADPAQSTSPRNNDPKRPQIVPPPTSSTVRQVPEGVPFEDERGY